MNSLNKSAALHVFGELIELHNYNQVVPCNANENNLIYFEATRTSKIKEYILPINETDSHFDIHLIFSLLDEINRQRETNKETQLINKYFIYFKITNKYFKIKNEFIKK
jgi:hypothetical protein